MSLSKKIRVISRLDIKSENVVKAVQTEGLHIVGQPKPMAYDYYNQGADEILYLDIVASLYDRNINYELLKIVAQDIFVPFTVGGGIRSLEDIIKVLRSGADKIAINTYGLQNPEFIKTAVKKFGAQCIVLSVDAKKRAPGRWEAYTEGGREPTGRDVLDWIKKGIALGVGEVLVSSIDMDGTGKGYDMELVEQVNALCPVPVIVHGGAGSLDSVKEAVLRGGADAVSISSMLHYNRFSIKDVKHHLKENNINVRLT